MRDRIEIIPVFQPSLFAGRPRPTLRRGCNDEIRGGVQIRVLDPAAIMNRRLVQFVADTAVEEGIPHQIAVRKSGGTDARSLQVSATGVPVVVLGVPARYIHSHNSLIDINDYLSAVRLVCAVVRKADTFTP